MVLTPGQLPPDDRSALGQCLELGESHSARDVFHAAIGRGNQPLRRQVLERGTDAGGDHFRSFRLGVAHADHSEYHGLVAEAGESRQVEIGLGGLDRDLLDLRGRELGLKRIEVRLGAGE